MNDMQERLKPEAQAKDDPRLVAALEQYRESLEQGHQPNRHEFLCHFPEIAGPLGACLDAMDFVHRVGSELSDPAANRLRSDVATTLDVHTTTPLGDYRLIREVGRGGMAVVYEAQQISLSRRVALKVLPFASTLDAKQLQRFKNEAQAAAQLHHTNIVPVFATGSERGVHYYAMQFIEGQTLAQLIQELGNGERGCVSTPSIDSERDLGALTQPRSQKGREQQRPAGEDTLIETPRVAAFSTQRSNKSPAFFRMVANLGVQAAEALEYAHSMGVIHRDIKPGNLIVESGAGTPACPRLWVTDFGLALYQTQPSLTMSGDLLGTLRYMSPEQALARRVMVDHRTDIYSLGVTLYELLTLEPALQGNDRQEILRRIAFEEPPLPQRANKAIPAELETIVLKAMEKNPEERYGTALELADDLRRFLEDKPIRARRPTMAQRVRKWTRRHKAATRGIISVAIVVLFGLVVFWLLHYLRLTDIARAVRESLAAAGTAVEAKDYALAQQKLVEAKAHLAHAGGKFRDLEAEVDGRTDAVDRLHQFLRLCDEARLRLGQQDSQSGNPAASEALALYGVVHWHDWSSRLEARYLGSEELTQIRETVYEMLLTLARQTIRDQADLGQKLTREVAARRSLAYLEKAQTDHVPTRGLYQIRSLCWRALGENEKAKTDEESAKAANVTTALDLHLAGIIAADAGEIDEALRQFQAALRLDPSYYWSLHMVGWCLWKMERHSEAVMVLTACIAMRSRHPEAYRLRALSLRKLGRHQEALADQDKAVGFGQNKADESDSESAPAYLHRGKARAKKRDIDGAIADYTKAIELDPESAAAYNLRANVRALSKRDYDGAIADCDRALQLDPEYGPAYANRGFAWLAKGDCERSLADLNKALELGLEDDPYTHCWRGDALARKGDWAGFIADYSKAVELDPNDAWPLHILSWRMVNCPDAKFRDPIRALELARKSIQLAPQNPYCWGGLGMAHYRNGNWKDAVTALDTRIRLDPRESGVYFFLAMARWQLGEKDQARQWYDKAVQWMDKNSEGLEKDKSQQEEFRRFRAEATELLGIKDAPKSKR